MAVKCRIPVVLAALSVVLLTGCSHDRYGGLPKSDVAAAAVVGERAGIMSAKETEQYYTLNGRVINREKLSTSDVDWLLALVDRPGTPAQVDARHLGIGSTLQNIQRNDVTTAQANRILALAADLASVKGGTDQSTSHMIACRIFGQFGGQQSTSYLTMLFNDPDPIVAREARKAARKLKKGLAKP